MPATAPRSEPPARAATDAAPDGARPWALRHPDDFERVSRADLHATATWFLPLGAALYGAFALIDWIYAPPAWFEVAVSLRAAAVLVSLGCALALRRTRPGRATEPLAYAGPLFAAVSSTVMAVLWSPGRNLYAVGLNVVLSAYVFLSRKPLHSLIGVGLITLAYPALALSLWGWPPPADAMLFITQNAYLSSFAQLVPLMAASGHELRFASLRTFTQTERERDLAVRLADEQRALADALAQARDAARHATLSRATFLAGMTHELRAPVTAVQGLTVLALRGEVAPRPRERLEEVRAAADTLLSVLDDVLDFSKLEAGRIEPERVSFRAEDVVERVRLAFAPRAARVGVALRTQVPADLPSPLVGDPLRLGQVLSQLTRNALEATTAGVVTLGVDVVAQTGDDVTLECRVSDTGRGLSEEAVRALTLAPAPGVGRGAANGAGARLGLALVRGLVATLGGRWRIESELGRGTTVHVQLPLARTEPDADARALRPAPDGRAVEDPGEGALEAARAQLRGARVLVVDDEETNRELAVELLSAEGLEVLTATDGEAALAALRAHRDVVCVLMDCQMPVLDGLEATRRIRRDPALAAIPVLAVTAGAAADDGARALAAGMNGLLAKPIVPQAALLAMARVAPAARPSGAATVERDADAAVARALDARAALAACGGDAALLAAVRGRFAETHERTAALLQAALEASDEARVDALLARLRVNAERVGAGRLAAAAARCEGARRAGAARTTLDTRLGELDRELGLAVRALGEARA